jgi:FAD/FMN-containing dehydrogenase
MVTGEHGIGLTRKEFLSLGLEATQVALMRQIKEDFDPGYILNPGKMFA